MQNWMALLPASKHEADDASAPTWQPLDVRPLGWWALQFTPRVAQLEEAVVLECHASERLFGGREALRGRLVKGAQAQGVAAWAFASNALAALCVARHRLAQGGTQADDANTHTTEQMLKGLPFTTLSALRPHAGTLARLGCRTLGEVRALPRDGLARRFGADLLNALDQAYGQRAGSHPWVSLPERFEHRLECPSAVEHAQGLLFGAQRLLNALLVWLAARQSGVLAFTLHWEHDRVRRSELRGGQVALRTAHATRDMAHLTRLLAEHLARTTLAAPATALRLVADEVAPLPTTSLSLLPGERPVGGEAGIVHL